MVRRLTVHEIDAQVRLATEVLAELPRDCEDEDVVSELVARDVPRDAAEQLLAFVPAAFGHVFLHRKGFSGLSTHFFVRATGDDPARRLWWNPRSWWRTRWVLRSLADEPYFVRAIQLASTMDEIDAEFVIAGSRDMHVKVAHHALHRGWDRTRAVEKVKDLMFEPRRVSRLSLEDLGTEVDEPHTGAVG
jgi:hypothetical protein